MKRAALGFQMHSGWGVVVAVSKDANAVTLLDRRRIVVADTEVHGAIQPYHFAAQLKPPEQERHLAHCAASSCQLAATAIAEVIRELDERHYRIVGSAILLASGRPLPRLAKILGAHPLIHTAEGEFFRQAVRQACEGLQIPVTAIRARELDAGMNKASELQRSIAGLGRTVGPPWTKDHKIAALAAAMLLAPA
jgi:hypothetical protein